MGKPPNAIPFLLFHFLLGVSWAALVPRPAIPSNATVFSHVYTIKLVGDGTENEGVAAAPQEALGPPGSSQAGGLYEHTLEGPDQEHVVFTHRINLPSQTCGCPPGTEDTQDLLRRLQALENEVRTLRETCQAGGGCCPATASIQASTGQTDIRTLCSHHGSFDLSRCLCECEPGWSGPTCAEQSCPGGCGGPQRGKCLNGRCQCRPGYSGARCEEPPTCPDDCNDQGRCVDGRCSCFQGYVGPSCSDPACPQDCRGHGQCVSGRCVCDPGYAGPDCGTRACPNNCNQRGECRNGRCVCNPGYSGPDCGSQNCPNNCNRRGECRDGLCICEQGYSGPDCATRACPNNCNQHGECRNGRCVCNPGYSGPDCGSQACPNNCNQRGECRNGRCVCNPGYSGPDCGSQNCPSNCNRRGECRDGLCICEQGYSGPDCATRACPNNCNQHGECRNGRCVCNPGYSGPDCGSQACPNNCNQRGECRNGRCVCNPGYSGPDCGSQNCPSNCNRRGECRDGLCICEQGYSGPDCATRACPNNCNQHGECRNGRCVCNPGYSGPDCGSRTCPSNCNRRGECRDGLCICEQGYSGPDCATRACPSNCNQHGECRNGRCVCNPGYSGPDCGSRTCPNNCNRRGECRDGTCICDQGYSGPDCGSRACPNNCNQRGECRNGRCVCNPGYSGPDCGTRTCPSNCNRRGECHDGLCICEQGYSGPDCGTRTCPNNCNQRGECRNGRCICDPGYSGPDCGTRTCPNNCNRHGKCRDGLCVCDQGYSGPDCGTRACPNNCNQRGECRDGRCVCEPGFTGPACGTKSCPNDCSQRGRCLKGGVCACHGGYTGPDCGQLACPEDCSGHGECQNGVCQCQEGYSGEDCSIEIPSIGVHVRRRDETSFRLEWSRPVLPVDGYEIQVAPMKDRQAGGSVRLPGTETSFERTGLVPGEEYNVTIRAEKGQRYGPPVSQTVRTRIAPPQGLQALKVTGSNVTLQWDSPAIRPDGYNLSYVIVAAGRPPQEPKSLELPATPESITLKDLESNTRYRITLTAHQSGESSRPATITTSTAAPEPREDRQKPTLGKLSVSEVTDNSVRLSWDIPVGSFNSFLIQYKDAEGKPKSQPVEGDAREATISNLIPSRKYKFNLYGLVDRKRVGPVSTETVTAQVLKPTLGELSASDVTSDSVHLSWTVPSGSFDTFLLQYKDAEGKPQVLPMEGDSREVTIPSLAPSRRYRFNLYGISNRKRLGPISTDAVTGPRQEEPTPTPEPILGDLSVSDASSDSVRLLWSIPVGSFDSFLLLYRDSKGYDQSLPVDRESREVTITNLVPSERYRFNLYGISGSQHLGPVSVDATTAASQEPTTEKPDKADPPSLGELSVSDVTSDSARLSWTIPTGSFQSFLVQFKDLEGKLQAVPVEGGSREVTIPNLTPSRRYKFNLYGISDRKRTGPISADVTTAATTASQDVQPTLGELSVSDVTSDSVRLSWTIPTGSFDSFLIQYKDAEGKPQTLPVEGGTREFTIPNLAPFHRYKFNLYGVSDRKRSGPISTDATTAAPTTAPEVTTKWVTTQPSLDQLSVSDVTSNSARLSWIVPIGNFDSFLVQYKDAEGKPQSLPVDGASRTLTVPNLEPSRRYKFNLYGVSEGKRLGPLSVEAVTAPSERDALTPPSLGKLSAFDVFSDSLRLTWNVTTGSFDSFLIQYKDAEGRPQTLPVDGGAREVTVSNLVPSRRYKFNLFGVSGRKRIGPVSTDAVTGPPMEPPLSPLSLGKLSANNAMPNSLDLSWTVDAGNFDSFIIQYRDAQDKPHALPVDGGLRSLHVHDLAPSHRYQFNLFGLSGRKRLGPVTTEGTTAPEPTTPPPQPTLGELSVSDVTSDSARLSWTVPSGSFDSFLIQYKDAEGKPQALPVDGGSREVTVPSLAPSRRYKFNLYGVSDGKRLGPVSTETVTAPRQSPVPPSLGELSASNIASDSVHLSWTVLTGSFDSFVVQYKDAEGKPQALPVEGVFREVTVPNLVPSRKYKFNLYGITGRKRLGPVSTDATTAPAETQAPPTLGKLSVSDVTSDSARLSWTVPKRDFNSFLIQYKDADGKPQSLPLDGSARETTISGLVPSHRYKFNLYGISGGKRFGPVNADTVTTAAEEVEEEVEEETEEGEEETGGRAPSLGELSISEATRDSVRLLWSVPSGNFDSFLIQYRDAEDKTQALPVDGGSREATVPNLIPSHRYRFDLYGLSGGKHLGPVSIDASTGQEVKERTATPPPQPNLGELSVSDVTSESARLSWFVPVGTFDSFLIQYKDAEGKPQAMPVDKETNSVVIYYLVPSHRYKFNLYGISGRRRFGPVSASTVTAKAKPPEEQGEEEVVTPTMQPHLGELSVSEITSGTAHLLWSVPVGSFDSFSVQYKDAEGKPQAIPVEGGSREVIVTNLAPSHKYRFNLYGISGQQRFGPISANAMTAKAEPPAEQVVRKEEVVTPPAQPRLGELSVSDVTSNTARLSWSVPMGSFDSFSVQYKDAEGKPQAIPVEGGTREVIVPNLAPSHKYRFNLYGISGQQRLGPISANAVTEASKSEPEEPGATAGYVVQPRLGDVTVSDITPDSLLLSWTIQEGSFESFLIQYTDAVGKLQVLPVDGAMRSLHLYNLTPSQRYKFNIYGVSGYKRFGPLSTDAVTAPETPPSGLVIQPRLGPLSISKVTSNSVSLSWSVPVGRFDSFLVQYKDAEGKPQVLPLDGDSRDATVPSLVPSRRYKFNLYGIYGPKRLGPVSTDAVTGPGKATPLKLGELLAHDVTAESLLLSWTVETGNFDSFIIQYRDSDGRPHALPVDGSLRSLRLHDLTPSHRYRFNLYGVSGRKRLGPITTEATTADSKKEPLPQPILGELSASNITATSIHLSWSVPSGNFASFSLHYRDAEGKPQTLPLNGTSREVVVSNLAPSRKFKFNLYGISGQKRFGPISTEAVTAQISKVPLKLGDLSISEVTKDSVRLSWTISSGKFDSFLIQYKDAEGQPQTLPVDADSRTVVVSDLTSSYRYKFNLYGISGRKQFGPISTDAVTAFPEAISEPSTLLDNLLVSEVMPTTLQLTWEAPREEFDSFLVRYKDSLLGSGRISPPAKEVKVPGDERSVMIRGLTPNTEYGFTLYGIRNGSEAANINTAARTSGLELDSPRDLRFSDIHETSVVANWRPPSARIDQYKVSFQPSDGGEPNSISVDGSKLRTTIEDLTPGTSYEVVVMSVRGFEESEPLVGYVTTVPDGPSDLRAVNVTDSSAVLTWQPAVAEMNNYIVTYGPAGGARVSESVPGNRAQLRLSELRLDTEYRASVYGEKEGNRSSPVSATFTTGADGPRDLRATEISPRSAHLAWSPPRAPPGGYLLSYETPFGEIKEIPLDASVTSYELQDLIPSSRYQVQVQALRRGTPTAPISTSFTTGHLMYPFPRDCGEESQNGPGSSRVTTIYLGGNQDRPLKVYCDMETDDGGWIVFQRRMNGQTDFWRDWQDYATGFGNLTREFWLGNDALHQLTTSGDYELRVDLRAGNESVYATYQHFRVDSPADYYRLHLGSYSGTAGDAFGYHSGSVFSTRDRDPNRLIIPCAVSYRGAWWYRNCHYTNLNGLYGNNRDHQGVNWFNWKGFEFSIPFTEMKLRPRGFRPLRRA
ncbi:tenascin-X isoform X2 [Tiliqua scincoides]|uniref:tenascin-X isoform X2 n=1 Tax=Tiliqua scincoides TaxID=71010 RepID=UPI003461C12A